MMQTKPTLNTASLTLRLRSRCIIISTSSMTITPPSRIGMGSRLNMARLRLTMHINWKNSAGPSRAAAPAMVPMPIGPVRFLDDMRLAVALVFDLDRLAAAVLGDLLELDLRVDRLTIYRDEEIALFHPSFFGRHVGLDS